MKTQVYYRYKEHPGDLFRSTDIIKLPDPDEDQETFLVQFLTNYQPDQTVVYLNDFYKHKYIEFSDYGENVNVLETVNDKALAQVDEEIKCITQEHYVKALRNFYNLVLYNRINIINDMF